MGSAVNDSTRLLGGTLGVAVIGSVYASLYSSKLSAGLPTHFPSGLSAIAHQSVGAAIAVSNRLSTAGLSRAGAAVHHAAFAAFLHGISVGCLVAGGVALVGALLAIAFLPSQPLPAASEVLEQTRDIVNGESVPSLRSASIPSAWWA